MNRILTLLLSAGVLVLAFASMSAANSNTFAGRNGKVVVVKKGTIGVLSKGGKFRKLNLAGRGVGVLNSAFAPDGNRVVYTTVNDLNDRFLRVTSVKKGAVKQLDIGELSPSYPSFLSNGKIVFSGSVSRDRSSEGTYRINTDGTGLRKLFGRKELAASPDGRHFVATDRRESFYHLDLLNKKGHVVRSLARDRRHNHRLLNPTFSPNGRWIAYQRQRSVKVDGRSEIYVVRIDGTHRRRITSTGGESPAFSPNGKLIVYKKTAKAQTYGNIATVSLKTGRVKMLTHAKKRRYTSPIWGRLRHCRAADHRHR